MTARALSIAALLALAAHAAAAPSLAAQGAAGGDVFVLTTGGDTIAVERYTRTAASLQSELLVRQAGVRIAITVDLAPAGGATRFRMAARQATADPSSPPLQSLDARLGADSVIAEVGAGGATTTQRFASRARILPFLNPSMALLELVVRQARAAGGDSVAVPVWNAQGGTTISATVVRIGADSVLVTLGTPLRLAVSSDGDILGGSIPAQKLNIVRVRGGGSADAALAAEKPDYSAPAGAPYTAEEVRIVSPKGHTLAGTLTIPKGASGRVPAAITITGSGAQERDEMLSIVKGYRLFRQVADTLGRHGIAVLRMDDRGWGASTGDGATATSADFADDIRAGLAYLRTRKEIDPSRLFLIGHSEGGLIAPMVAATDTGLFAIVLMAGPSQKGRTILEYQIRNGITNTATLSAAQKDSALRGVPQTIDSLAAHSPWMKFFFDHDPLVTARRVKVPTLILQGETDRQVTAAQAEELAAALRAGGNRDVTVRLFPRANHLFLEDADGNPALYSSLRSGAVRSDVLGAMLEWLRVKLR